MTKYPIIIEPNIYQYDEHVYVWFDEVGAVGGATNYLEEARREMQNCANSLSSIRELLETTETLYDG